MSQLQLRIFDGARQLFTPPANFLIRIVDGNQHQQHADYHRANDLLFNLPFFDNFGDDYTILVSADGDRKTGYKQAGFFPVKLSNSYQVTLDLMLIPNSPGFNFADARWPAAHARFPFLAATATAATASPTPTPDPDPDPAPEQRYNDLLDRHQRALACFLNLGEAMRHIDLAQGTPLAYIKALRWDTPYYPTEDRFFAWCDPALVDQVRRAAAEGKFAVENAPSLFHPGATASWKQVQFGEANVQLTFHENTRATVAGKDCIMLEPDMDYYRDPLAHVILEIVPNALTHTLTDPAEVYVLRWIAGQTAGVPEFAPLFKIL